jgi:uncharacterized protein
MARQACLASALLVALLWALPERAHALDVPSLSARVNDHAHVLAPERAAALEAKLAAYQQRSGHQLALLTIDSLQGDAIEPFAIRVAEQWKLGDAKRDDGLLLIVVPSERKLRIEVGYGLEGVLPDAVAARVIRETIAPAFQRGDYAGGIDQAFDVLMRTASGEAPPAAAPSTAPQGAARRSPISMLVLLLFIFSLLSMTRRGRRLGGGMWLGPLIGAGMGGLGGGRGGGFGGGGGGGFRGGGGRFGGGGASGGW